MLYTLYCPVVYQSKIKGYWTDENGNVFVDNIQILFNLKHEEFEDNIADLIQRGEKAIFFIWNNKAYIKDAKTGQVKKLRKRIVYNIKEKDFEIMKGFLLRKFGGFTSYEKEGGFTLEIWTN